METTSNDVDTSTKQAAAAAATRKLNIDLLKIIHAARQTYGLRTNDYARYHAHCVRRVNTLHRATKTLNKASSSSKKNAVATTASSKKGKKNTATSSTKNNNTNKASFTSTTSQITSDAVLKDERLLELLVWEAERSWSEGMKQREEIAGLERSNSSQALASKRHRAAKRFHKACLHAEALSAIARTLYTLPSDPITASAVFQIEIYYQYMRGTFAFVKVSSPGGANAHSRASISPTSALETLSQAYVLLETYGQASQHATEEAIAFELLDELEPLIRFCAYKSGSHAAQSPGEIAKNVGGRAVVQLEDPEHYPNLIAKLDKEQSALKRKGRKDVETVHQLTWRDIDIPIRSAELADTLGRVKKAIGDVEIRRSGVAISKLSKGKYSKPVSAAVYDRSLAVLIEAEDKARKLVEDNATALARAHSARFESAAKPLTLVHSYILFHLLSIRTQRDETLLRDTSIRLSRREAKVATQDSAFGPISMRVKRRRMKLYPIVVKLLDGMTQSYEKMRHLAAVEEDSTDLAEEVDALLAFVKARRCLYLGQTYAILDKYPEAITLLQRGGLYLREVRSLYDSLVPRDSMPEDAQNPSLPMLKSTYERMPSLQVELEEAESRARKDWYLHTLQATKPQEEAAPIDEAVKTMSLQTATSAKHDKRRKKAGPIFFDVAFSYIAPVGTEMLVDSLNSAPMADVPGDTKSSAVESNVAGSSSESSPLKDAISTAQTVAPEPISTAGRGLWGLFGRRK